MVSKLSLPYHCNKCKLNWPAKHYYGCSRICKRCHNGNTIERERRKRKEDPVYREAQVTKARRYAREWYANNQEQAREQSRVYQKQRYATDPAWRVRAIKRAKAWQASNAEQAAATRCIWMRNNRERVAAYMRDYYRQVRKVKRS